MGSTESWGSIIAIIGIYIAFEQWRTARNKLQFDLYDRRYAIFQKTRAFLTDISLGRTTSNESQFEFFNCVPESKWLFNDQIEAYLRELHLKSIDLDAHIQKMADEPDNPSRQQMIEDKSSQKKWLGNQMEVVSKKFAPFLTIQDQYFWRFWR